MLGEIFMLGAGGRSFTCIFSRIKLKKPHILLKPGFEVLLFLTLLLLDYIFIH